MRTAGKAGQPEHRETSEETLSPRVRSRLGLLTGLALLLSTILAEGQGTFQNLNFERATVSPTPVNGYGDRVDPVLAFPGWTVDVVWAGTNTYALFTLYNNMTLDSPAVDLVGPSFPNGLGLSALEGV